MVWCCERTFFLQLLLAGVTIAMVVKTSNSANCGGSPANGKLPHLHRAVSYNGRGMIGGSGSRRAMYMRTDSIAVKLYENDHLEWQEKLLAKREARPHSAPYVVSIQMTTPNGELVHYCAGTIINEHWILTAAHCLGPANAISNSVIVAGCHDIREATTASESNYVQVRNIDHYVSHDLYLGGINPYDIALLYTHQPLNFNAFVQPAQLPEQDALAEGYGTLYGWGNVSMTVVPEFPHKLQEADMPILDMKLCEGLLAASGYTLHETNICTGPLSGGISICTADSGGPLMQQMDNEDNLLESETSIIIGIVSWGKIPCGQRNAPSVFVRVSAFTNWINDIIGTTTTHDH